MTITGPPKDLPLEVRQTLRAYLAEVTGIFGSTLQAVMLYGSAARGDFLPGRSNLNLLLLMSDHDLETLTQYGKAHRRWSREHIVVPLIQTLEELRRSLDLFPLEYLEIKQHHVLLAGRDPFPELDVPTRNLRLQCEQELRGNLLRLRQRFVEGAGKPEAAAILLPLSLTAVLACLRGLFRLLGSPGPGTAESLLNDSRTLLGVDVTALPDVLNLKRGLITPGPVELPRLFERYTSSLQMLIEKVDELKTKGRLQ
ncbi:MAG: hypothetical protein ACREIS_09760 [Nitrospiraceae bacterium]